MAAFLSIVHAVAAVLAIIELGLTAYLSSTYAYDTPSRISFMIFNSIWTLLVLAYVGITPIYMTGFFHKLAALALNVITTIFWFAGAIALSVWWGARDCHGNGWCQTAEAACAFGFFLWAIFMFLTVLDALESLRSRGHNAGGPKASSAHPGA